VGRRETFDPGQSVEFCPVSCRDTSSVKWRPGVYVGDLAGAQAGWHRVKIDAFGTIELIPWRRLRAARGAKP
jgi:hypothetical protein